MFKVGVFGGSFNPPHIAHVQLTSIALSLGVVDQVWWVPTFDHAFGKNLAPYDDRVAMVRCATSMFGDAVIVSNAEQQLAAHGPSRTWRLLGFLSERLKERGFVLEGNGPTAQLRLLIGSDIIAETAKWERWSEVASAAPPWVVPRIGQNDAPIPFETSPVAIDDVSSTAIRQAIANGHAPVHLPNQILRYIVARGLYR